MSYYAPPLIGGYIKQWCCLSVWCLTSVANIGPKSRTESPRKTKIGTEIANITRDSDTTFKVKGQGQSPGHFVTAALRRQAAAAVSVGTYWRGKLLLHCCLLSGTRRFGAHRRRRGAGSYRGGRPPAYSLLKLHSCCKCANDSTVQNFAHFVTSFNDLVQKLIKEDKFWCFVNVKLISQFQPFQLRIKLY